MQRGRRRGQPKLLEHEVRVPEDARPLDPLAGVGESAQHRVVVDLGADVGQDPQRLGVDLLEGGVVQRLHGEPGHGVHLHPIDIARSCCADESGRVTMAATTDPRVSMRDQADCVMRSHKEAHS